nr:hypothetical protein [Tanacetum cinerariifolium]
MHDQLNVNKEMIELSNDEDVSSNEGETKRSRSPIRQDASTSTSNAQVASTSAPRGYRKIAMTGCVLALRAFNDPNASTSAPRKRKSKKP